MSIIPHVCAFNCDCQYRKKLAEGSALPQHGSGLTALIEQWMAANDGDHCCFRMRRQCAIELSCALAEASALPQQALRELHDAAESFLRLYRVRGEDLREEATHRLRNALAASREALAEASALPPFDDWATHLADEATRGHKSEGQIAYEIEEGLQKAYRAGLAEASALPRLRALSATWRLYADQDDNDQWGNERQAVYRQCADELDAALAEASARPPQPKKDEDERVTRMDKQAGATVPATASSNRKD